MRDLLCPERLRTIEKPFAWLPCRLLTDGTLAQLSQPAKLLYLLLALAADRRGLSFFGDCRIAHELSLTPVQIAQARQELITWQLLVFDGATYQLLSWPSSPATMPELATPANPHAPEQPTPRSNPITMPEEVRQAFRHILALK